MASSVRVASKLDEFDYDDDESVADMVNGAKANSAATKSQMVEKGAMKQQSVNEADIGVVKKKRVSTMLTPSLLLHKDGLENLLQRAEKLKFNSVDTVGYELSDLARLLGMYRAWAETLGAREGGHWPDFVDKLDRLKKNEIRKVLTQMRNGEYKPSSSVSTSMPPPSVANTSFEPSASTFTSSQQQVRARPAEQPTIPTISDELKRRIEEKRLEALRRRQQRAEQVLPSASGEVNPTVTNAVPMSQLPTQIVSHTEEPQTQIVSTQIAQPSVSVENEAQNDVEASTQIVDHQVQTPDVQTADSNIESQESNQDGTEPNQSQVGPENVETRSENTKKQRLVDETELDDEL